MIPPELLAAVPTVAVAVLGLIVNARDRARKALAEAGGIVALAEAAERKALAEACNQRIAELEQAIAGIHGLDNRLTAAETRIHGANNSMVRLSEEIAEVRENMVRRGELDALGQRIDDVFRLFRPTATPPPRRPRRGE
jgi:uncharacterized coiled-coil protein SlyX